ncbi:VanZ family protein [Robiginitalea sp. M39]|uniref:VanZ family protein n=2 Tax=Robiginitalea aurantiaca TaxID=3056915 RepID=A0ABT7WBY7_9FLAO|nr:VanZ family protein [Robiginitalea aurantiaca]
MLFLFWMIMLTVLCLLPSDNLSVKTPPIPYLDKWVHFTFYAVAMTLGALFMRERMQFRLRRGKALLFMGAGLIIYGMIIEVLQGISEQGRSAEWWDIGANILGIAFGAGLSLLLFRNVSVFYWED